MSNGDPSDVQATLDVLAGKRKRIENEKTWLRHRIDSEAGRIDLEILNEISIKEIANRVNVDEERVERHIKHLADPYIEEKNGQKDHGVPVIITPNAVRFNIEGPTIRAAEYSSADEVDGSYIEGRTKQVLVNAYERDSEARTVCIRELGTTCVICGFNFGRFYGRIAEDFIHVHHIKPLSEIKAEHKVNPLKDLVPICPNCHAVVHLKGKCRTVEEVQSLIRTARDENKNRDE